MRVHSLYFEFRAAALLSFSQIKTAIEINNSRLRLVWAFAKKIQN